MAATRTARDWRWPVTVLLEYRTEHKGDVTVINDRDRLMALALTHYEDSLCGDCGQPSWVGYGVENIDRAEFKTDVCHWCESAATARRDLEKEHKDGIPDGWKLLAYDTADTTATPTT